MFTQGFRQNSCVCLNICVGLIFLFVSSSVRMFSDRKHVIFIGCPQIRLSHFRCLLYDLIRRYASLVFCRVFSGKPRQNNQMCVGKCRIFLRLFLLHRLETGHFSPWRAPLFPVPVWPRQHRLRSTVCSPLRKLKSSTAAFFICNNSIIVS